MGSVGTARKTIGESIAMILKRYTTVSLTVAMLLLATRTAAAQPTERVLLNQTTIVMDPAQPEFVRHGVGDLTAYLDELTANKIPVVASADGVRGVRILVGAKSVQRSFPQAIPDEKLGGEGYRLRAELKDGVRSILVTGSTPRGTKAALGTLMKKIAVEGKSAFLPSSLSILHKPSFAKRGLHFNGWAIKYPYSFRCWREEDWQRYLDILSYQNVNLLYFWPFIEIMPAPLSPEDEAYLEECRRIVDYAQKKHGMEVWIMQCTNRVAKDNCGVADPRHRPYWRPSQEDLNPGNPEHFKAIMASREAMYRIINNADGVCNIDSDPGFFPGSPLADYVRVLKGCRGLLDRHNIHRKNTLLVNWMLWGWGRSERFQVRQLDEHQRRTVQLMKKELPEPWWLISSQFGFLPDGQYQFLPICRDEEVLEKTVVLPYGNIEYEPSYPGTNLFLAEIRGTFDKQIAKFPGLAGVVGNVQTPLNQFPNLYFFTSTMHDLDYRKRPEADVLQDLSALLYPDHKQLVTECFLALKGLDPVQIEVLAGRLDRIVQDDQLGRLGVFARKLFPDHRIVANCLLLQLRFRAARQRLLLGISPTAPGGECQELLCDYFDSYLNWDEAHGWHELWGWTQWPLPGLPQAAVADSLRKNLGGDSDVEAFFSRVASTLSAKHDAKSVQQGCIAPLKSAVLAAEPRKPKAQ